MLVIVAADFGILSAQESLLSEQAEYSDFLALVGLADKPTLNYRTLSDDVWESSPSIDNAYVAGLPGEMHQAGSIEYRFYGPTMFTSYNTAFPHGSNDGALWQGVGLNLSAEAGIRLEASGFEATLKPRISWCQNEDFDTMPSAYNGQTYADYGITSIDLYQRPGDESEYFFDWGDSEIRYTYGKATIGFGTQAIWLGPARLNPILSSNNAAPYPKMDLGLRKTPTILGEVEARFWVGRLTESKWFDDGNDHVLIDGLSLSWAPSFVKGLTFGFHRTLLANWSDSKWSDAFILVNPFNFFGNSNNANEVDQRGSITIDYVIPSVGLETYLEWARNDFSSSLQLFIVDPFHSQAYTIGARKSLYFRSGLRGELNVELTSTEESRDFALEAWDSTFYSHSTVLQGYTNEGQCIGAGIGTGGNSQYLRFSMYYPSGRSTVYIQRRDRNNDYLWAKYRGYTGSDFHLEFSTEFVIGTDASVTLSRHVSARFGLAYDMVFNPLYESWHDAESIPRTNNFYFSSGISLRL
jgi:hypothetical protein